MVFSSMLFLWGFLPLIFIGYFLIPDKYKNMLLLLGSVLFYAWGEPRYIVLLLCSILINYVIGLLIDSHRNQKKLLLILDIVINIGVLGYFKYFNFLISIVSSCTGKEMTPQDIKLPIGISFFTFQILSYIIDLYRGGVQGTEELVSARAVCLFFPAANCRAHSEVQRY